MNDGAARYVCGKYPNLQLVMHPGGSQPMMNTRTGLQELHVVDPKIIKFHNYEYWTSDPEEIEFIEKHVDFTGNAHHPKIIEKAAEEDKAQMKLMQLITKHGADKVLAQLEKKKAAKKAAKKAVKGDN